MHVNRFIILACKLGYVLIQADMGQALSSKLEALLQAQAQMLQ